jgi:hypothetical protein
LSPGAYAIEFTDIAGERYLPHRTIKSTLLASFVRQGLVRAINLDQLSETWPT